MEFSRDKTAQERSFLNNLREKTNLYGKALEGINGEFASMMTRLRSTDERIRAQAEGVRDLIKSARQQVNRRDYLAAAIDLTEFHKKCRYITADLSAFIKSIDEKNYKVLLDQFDDEQKNQLFGYDPNKEISLEQAAVDDKSFETTAGLLDVVHNLTSERGRAMRALEKNFSIAFLNDLKKNSNTMVELSERFVGFLLMVFKRLATALARRKVREYADIAKKFISKFSGKNEYHDRFVKYYNDNIIPLKQQHETISNNKLEEERLAEETKTKAIENASFKQHGDPSLQQTPSAPSVSPEEWHQRQKDQKKLENMMGVQKAPTSSTNNMPIDLTQQKQKAANFISKLEKIASNNDHKTFINEILTFSHQIEDLDIESSLKLIAIAEGIVEDYNVG